MGLILGFDDEGYKAFDCYEIVCHHLFEKKFPFGLIVIERLVRDFEYLFGHTEFSKECT